MLVTVRSRVLVPEPYHVTQLVHHDAELVAVLADGDGLRSVASLAHKRTTAGRGENKTHTNHWRLKQKPL